MEELIKAYRYEDIHYAPSLNEFDDPIGGVSVEIHLKEYLVLSKTSKGIWIENCGKRKFILLSAKKKFAALTKQEAFKDFRCRKNIQLYIQKARLRSIEEVQRLILNWNQS